MKRPLRTRVSRLDGRKSSLAMSKASFGRWKIPLMSITLDYHFRVIMLCR